MKIPTFNSKQKTNKYWKLLWLKLIKKFIRKVTKSLNIEPGINKRRTINFQGQEVTMVSMVLQPVSVQSS